MPHDQPMQQFGTVRVGRDRRVTIPRAALALTGLGPGVPVIVEGMEDGTIVLRDPLQRYIGSMTGMYPPGYLDELRDEWER